MSSRTHRFCSPAGPRPSHEWQRWYVFIFLLCSLRGASSMADNRRVFVGMIPTNNLGEPELMKMFSFYGPVKKIFIMKGAAIVNFASSKSAELAIKMLHNSKTFEGCQLPLVVRPADKKNKKKKKVKAGNSQNQNPGQLTMNQGEHTPPCPPLPWDTAPPRPPMKEPFDEYEMSFPAPQANKTIMGCQLPLVGKPADKKKKKKRRKKKLTKSMTDGTKSMTDGTKSMTDGTKSMTDGTKSMMDETKAMMDGTKSMMDGTKTMTDETKSMMDETKSMMDGTKSMMDGTKSMMDDEFEMIFPAPQANHPIMMAAHALHMDVKHWLSRDKEILAAAKKMALLMAKLSRLVRGEGGSNGDLINCAESIAELSMEITEIAKALALDCTDEYMRTNLLQVCEHIPTIGIRLKGLSTAKATMLEAQGSDEDITTTDMLVFNAQRLTQLVHETVAASINICLNSGYSKRSWYT